MLELMKELLSIDLLDTSKDSILNHYLNKSQIAIKAYSYIEEIPESLDGIVVDLAIFFYQNKDAQGIIQQTQGSRSKTIIDGIPESIKSCLPLPRIKVVG
ncbi:phage head-tail connector protein [Desulfosporosinus youngiae]|uniref:Phage QLRG family, putative DNA packaging protein n=1 Tax=Desulfosporosinus youngiae DSM 17734 TaxID=768710 RepID=H5Y568_9FIRM|nr:phage head-tail connector protein [Desulfosporosinus youngiae]EHQ90172.1 Phage QLRG family, putative DNA packaging protein [Desulfosporosinus youngiae DSM 17734]